MWNPWMGKARTTPPWCTEWKWRWNGREDWPIEISLSSQSWPRKCLRDSRKPWMCSRERSKCTRKCCPSLWLCSKKPARQFDLDPRMDIDNSVEGNGSLTRIFPAALLEPRTLPIWSSWMTCLWPDIDLRIGSSGWTLITWSWPLQNWRKCTRLQRFLLRRFGGRDSYLKRDFVW